jgi:hypothetical protein
MLLPRLSRSLAIRLICLLLPLSLGVSGGGQLRAEVPAPATAPLVAPTSAEVAALLTQAPTGHPRLFADKGTFTRIQAQATTDPRLATLIAAVLAQAEAAVRARPVERILEGKRLLGVSRTALGRLTALGAAWRLTGDVRFARRGEQELLTVCAFSDWHPPHFLDVGEMTLAVAIGYDWLFDALPETTRTTVRQALVTHGIAPSFPPNKPQWWVNGSNNWTQVCHAGLIAGALVMHEQERDLAVQVVQRAVANLPRVMAASFAPDGAYPEGPGYWEYGTTFNLVAIDALRTVLGQDFGLTRVPGFLATADYIAHAHGANGQRFSYADCGAGTLACVPAQVWYARERQAAWELPLGAGSAKDKSLSGDRLLALALTWADRQTDRPTVGRPLDYYGDGPKPVAMFRSAWGDPQALYLGVCGGTPSSSHGHMDVGAFVFDAGGVRWSVDLGMENYNKLETAGVDLWNAKQSSQRWSIFRLNNHGHSTLVLGGQLQQVKGMARISEFRNDARAPGCTVDLTTVYAGQARRVERRFDLPERQRLVVSDRITELAQAGTVRWQLVTRAQVVIAEDGRRARLTQDGRTLDLAVESPADARLVVAEAVGGQPYDTANPGVRVLAAEVDGKAGATIEYRVSLTP